MISAQKSVKVTMFDIHKVYHVHCFRLKENLLETEGWREKVRKKHFFMFSHVFPPPPRQEVMLSFPLKVLLLPHQPRLTRSSPNVIVV